MIPVSKAIRIIKRRSVALENEVVELDRAVGRVLAEDIRADSDLPPFDRSQMDGFAVIAKDTIKVPADLEIVGESAAGSGWHKTLKPGQTVRIMTGAPVPKGADAVQKVELTHEPSERTVTILESAEKGKYIIRKGLEMRKGAKVFAKGSVVTRNMIAALAAFGYPKVLVSKQPKLAILGTGSEIVEVSEQPGPDQIRNSNSAMLKALARKYTASATVLPIAKDRVSDLKRSIKAACAKNDIVVLTGGVSVGKYDFTKTALQELGAEIFFQKIALKPGKPAVFAKLGSTFIFGLPGNPVSAAVTFHLFVRELILLMQNAADSGPRHGFAVIDGRAKGAKERDTYLPAKLETDNTGRLIAKPVKWHGSSDFIGFAGAEALVVIPMGGTFENGDVAGIVYL